jgi:hypothetical protein
VFLYLDDDGTFEELDEVVLGIQATVTDTYTGPKVLQRGQSGPRPEGDSAKDIIRAGYHLNGEDQHVEHDVVIFSEEYHQPTALDSSSDIHGDRWVRILGPKDAPADWWEKRIKSEKRMLLKDHKPKQTDAVEF